MGRTKAKRGHYNRPPRDQGPVPPPLEPNEAGRETLPLRMENIRPAEHPVTGHPVLLVEFSTEDRAMRLLTALPLEQAMEAAATLMSTGAAHLADPRHRQYLADRGVPSELIAEMLGLLDP